MTTRPVVAVVGPGGAEATDPVCDLAAEVGRLLARRGVPVLTGGLDGVMAAAARGVAAEGGLAIGLLPGTDRTAASPDLAVALATDLGQARNALIAQAADGMIAVGCSWGTLSEIALAKRQAKPVICLRGWQVTDESGAAVPLDTAASPAEAVDILTTALQRRG